LAHFYKGLSYITCGDQLGVLSKVWNPAAAKERKWKNLFVVHEVRLQAGVRREDRSSHNKEEGGKHRRNFPRPGHSGSAYN
jgi:hypothetical protein